MNEAVENCKETFRSWSKTTILQRQQIMFRYQDLIKKNMVRLIVSFCMKEFHYFNFYLEKNCREYFQRTRKNNL